MREAGPLPMLRTYAVCASTASTSRKSSASVVTLNLFHVAPPSVVRNTVPPEPLAHATRSLTALTPRKRAVTPLDCNFQLGANAINATAKTSPYLIFVYPRLRFKQAFNSAVGVNPQSPFACRSHVAFL